MKVRCGLVCAAALLLLATLGRADEAKLKTAAKEVLAKYQDALVTVKLLVKLRGSTSESQLEIAGTVLTPAGLTVVSDFTSNPYSLFSPGEDKTETIDVKLILKDGREVPSSFVLRDRELDLAFVMPKDKEQDLPHLKLDQGPVPEPLDDLVYLYPLGKSLNRQAAVTLGRVEAVVKKPRLFVVSDLFTGVQSLGSPVFDGTGRPVGVVVLRRSPTPPKSVSGVRDVLDLLKPVILTAKDIQLAANQIAKPGEKPK
jgi:hypothetical protein